MERTIVVGDIHGCYVEFMDLLGHIGPTQRDRIICVGDLITKGPRNREVLDFVRLRENCQSILGNHEYVLLRHRRGIAVELKPEHFKTIAELGKDFNDYMDWISQWPLYIDLGDYLVVHAGIRPDRSMEDQTIDDLTQLRALEGPDPGSRHGTPWFERYEGRQVMIFGHWPREKPLLKGNVVGLDTGCVYGGRLTAIVLPERRLVSVPARSVYSKKDGGK